jgi:general secretion pathway protein L
MDRRQIEQAISRWIETVAAAVMTCREAFASPALVTLVERREGGFSIRAPQGAGVIDRSDPEEFAGSASTFRGARVDLVLRPDRFMFRPLELPARASDFVDDIILAQIDRLTPWSAVDGVFGWRPGDRVDDDKISILIAATARSLIDPFVDALAALGAHMVAVSVGPPEEGPAAGRIEIVRRRFHEAYDVRRLRTLLLAVLGASGALALASVVAAIAIGGEMEARRDEIARRIEDYRGGLDAARGGEAATLVKRKQETFARVMVLETLAKILPNHTYLTELGVIGDKLQMAGVTQDAPSLIRLIEQSPHFASASFVGPTTPYRSEQRQQFSIEAKIEPNRSSPR